MQNSKKSRTAGYIQKKSLFWRAFIVNVALFILAAATLSAGLSNGFAGGKTPVTAVCVLSGLVLFFTVLLFLLVTLPLRRLEKTLTSAVKNTEHSAEMERCIRENAYTQRWLWPLLLKFNHSSNREYTMQILKKQVEIKTLQSQINPHFLYNTLETIRGKALIEGVDEVANMAEALGKLFRYSINKYDDVATLEEELYHLENYLLIQQYRFNDKFNIKKEIPSDEAVLSVLMPKMTIQPIIENAIFHGLETKVGRGTISIRARQTESRVIVTIGDDGVGISEEMLSQINHQLRHPDEAAAESSPQGMGIALANVNKRIKLFCGENYGLTIYSTLGMGTDVELVIPLRYR